MPKFKPRIFQTTLLLIMSKNGNEVLVRVEGVSKKFCRSLKKSLWYGVCDIASEINPFGRTAAFANPHKNLTTEVTESTEGNTGVNQLADSGEFFIGHSQAGLQMDSEKLASIRSANDSRASGEQTGSDSESVLTRDIRGKKSSSALDLPKAQSDWGYALKDVSFEVKRWGRRGGTESLGRLKEEQRKLARRAQHRGRCKSTVPQAGPQALRPANQIALKFDEIVEFSGCVPAHRSSYGLRVTGGE